MKIKLTSVGILLVIVFLFVGVLYSNAFSDSDTPIEQIKTFCADKWSIDYEMERRCVNNQITAAINMIDRLNSAKLTGHYTVDNLKKSSTDETKILAQCFVYWEDSQGRSDWEMIDSCSENQLKAYNSLR